MPYQAERDATIPKVIGKTRNPDGERVAHYESVTYSAGAIIFEEDIAPHVLRRLEEGDDHVSSLLRYVDEAEARKILREQAQEAASQPSGEREILHQEERLGSSPSVEPETEVADAPPYEAPPTSGATDGEQVVTEDQTVGQGTGGTEEDESTAEEEPEGTSEPDADSSGDTNADGGDEQEQGETESETSGDGDNSDEGQEEGKDQADDAQEESAEGNADEGETDETETSTEKPTSDKFDEMSRKALLAEAKARKIAGRTKMNDDQLRQALRAE